jgi:hypothetical protein
MPGTNDTGAKMPVQFKNPKPKLSEAEIDKAEIAIGVKFPSDYRSFLLRTNGGRPSPDEFDILWEPDRSSLGWRRSMVDWFLSIYDGQYSNLVEYNTVDFRNRIPRDTIATAYDPGGNLILMGVGDDNNGKIFFWVKDHEVEEGEVPGYDNVAPLANSLHEFLDSLTSVE